MNKKKSKKKSIDLHFDSEVGRVTGLSSGHKQELLRYNIKL